MEKTSTRKSHAGRWLVILLVVVVGVVVLGLVTSDQRSNSSTNGLRDDKLTQMEHSGTMQQMLEQHQRMMEQMRAALSPRMQP